MTPDIRPTESELQEEHGSLERLIFFSDAVFAIAMTLLVIDIHVPEARTPQELTDQLLLLWPNMLGFVISFLVISTYWRVHHRLFRYIKRYDQLLITLNFALLFLVTLLPFTTALISEYGNWQLPAVIYDASLVLASLIFTVLWWHAARNHRLVDANLDQSIMRYNIMRSLSMTLAFACVIVLTFFMNAARAQAALLLLIPLRWIEHIYTHYRNKRNIRTLDLKARVPARKSSTPEHPPKV